MRVQAMPSDLRTSQELHNFEILEISSCLGAGHPVIFSLRKGATPHGPFV